jgi:hypothetical protein
MLKRDGIPIRSPRWPILSPAAGLDISSSAPSGAPSTRSCWVSAPHGRSAHSVNVPSEFTAELVAVDCIEEQIPHPGELSQHAIAFVGVSAKELTQ